jgi:hypothetical protein
MEVSLQEVTPQAATQHFDLLVRQNSTYVSALFSAAIPDTNGPHWDRQTYTNCSDALFLCSNVDTDTG